MLQHITIRASQALLASAVWLGVFASARADDPGVDQFGWVWANDPTSASYTPAARYNRNSMGSNNTVQRLGTGQYLVLFGSLGFSGGTAQVTAYGSDGSTCRSWFIDERTPTKRLFVACFDSAGNLADTRYTASYYKHFDNNPWSLTGGYALIDDPTSWVDSSSNPYRWNSSGQSIAFARASAGNYLVRFWGQSSSTPHFEVTAYGLFGSQRCKLAGTTTAGLATVWCNDSAGNFVDSGFFIAYTNGSTNPALKAAHLRSDAAGNVSDSSNAFGGTNSVARLAQGSYRATFPSMASSSSGGTVRAVALSTGNTGNLDTHCKVSGWFTSGTAIQADILCFSRSGTLSDSPFTVRYMR